MMDATAEKYCEMVVAQPTPSTERLKKITRMKLSTTFITPAQDPIISGVFESPTERNIAATVLYRDEATMPT